MLHETLFETLNAAEDTLKDVVLDDLFWRELFQHGINYNQSQTEHMKIVSIKGKPTRKYFHVVISRLETGRYELVSYIS